MSWVLDNNAAFTVVLPILVWLKLTIAKLIAKKKSVNFFIVKLIKMKLNVKVLKIN